jgi:hypothetical protein
VRAASSMTFPLFPSTIKVKYNGKKPSHAPRDRVNKKTGKIYPMRANRKILCRPEEEWRMRPKMSPTIKSKYPANVFASPAFPSKGAVILIDDVKCSHHPYVLTKKQTRMRKKTKIFTCLMSFITFDTIKKRRKYSIYLRI